jgi:ABC-type phosphate/phosphonate transport system substrate-binding protein
MIVNARMYSATPAAKQAWNELLSWALLRADLPWQIHDYDAPAPLASLWARTDLGCVLMCGLAYSRRQPQPALVAAPVPSPARYAGRAIYFTDIVVRTESSFERLEDTFGSVVGYTLPDSLSGCVALRSHLLPYSEAAGRRPLYRKAVGGFVNARALIEALASDLIDVAPLDSFYHDLLELGAPQLAARVRTIASTPAAPIPPFVATGAIAETNLERLRAALAAVGTAPELAAARATLLLDRLAVPSESDYAAIRTVAQDAARYGDPW